MSAKRGVAHFLGDTVFLCSLLLDVSGMAETSSEINPYFLVSAITDLFLFSLDEDQPR